MQVSLKLRRFRVLGKNRRALSTVGFEGIFARGLFWGVLNFSKGEFFLGKERSEFGVYDS